MTRPHTACPVRCVIPHNLTQPHTLITIGVCEDKIGSFLRVSALLYTLLTHLKVYLYMERVKMAENCHSLNSTEYVQPILVGTCVRRPAPTPYPSSAAASVVRTQSGPRATTCARTSAGSATVYFGIVSPVEALRPDRPFTPPLPRMPGMSGGQCGADQGFSLIPRGAAVWGDVDKAITASHADAAKACRAAGFPHVFLGSLEAFSREGLIVHFKAKPDDAKIVGADYAEGDRGGFDGHLSVSVASDVLSIPKTYSRQQGSADFSHTEHFYARAA